MFITKLQGHAADGFFAETKGSGDFPNKLPFSCAEGWWELTGNTSPIHRGLNNQTLFTEHLGLPG